MLTFSLEVVLVIDFTKLVLEHGRVTCFTIVEITRSDDGTLKYSYSDYFLKDGSEDAAYVAYALWVRHMCVRV